MTTTISLRVPEETLTEIERAVLRECERTGYRITMSDYVLAAIQAKLRTEPATA